MGTLERMNYIIQRIQTTENCTKKELKEYCLRHNIVASEIGFERTINKMLHRHSITICTKHQILLYKRSYSFIGSQVEVNYNGTTDRMFYDPGMVFS